MEQVAILITDVATNDPDNPIPVALKLRNEGYCFTKNIKYLH